MPHVLLIDDDELFRKMLRATLEEMGHAVTEARDGKEGLALHDIKTVDVVITDLIMPEKEGVETIIELRKKHPRVKIIAISGGGRMSAAGYLNIARQLGADQVLKKPFSTAAMAVAMAALS